VICERAGRCSALCAHPFHGCLGLCFAMALGKFLGAHLASQPGPSDRTARYRLRTWLYFTPTVAGEVAAHWYLLIAAAMSRVLLAYAERLVLMPQCRTRCNHRSFASFPGGAARDDRPGRAATVHAPIEVVLARPCAYHRRAHVPFVFNRDRFARCRRLSARAVRRGRRRPPGVCSARRRWVGRAGVSSACRTQGCRAPRRDRRPHLR